VLLRVEVVVPCALGPIRRAHLPGVLIRLTTTYWLSAQRHNQRAIQPGRRTAYADRATYTPSSAPGQLAHYSNTGYFGPIYRDDMFAPLFSHRGRPAETRWRLTLVSVMQFAERLSGRRAADAVQARIDWKCVLGLPLDDPDFDCDHAVLGIVRTDSTHVLAAIRAAQSPGDTGQRGTGVRAMIIGGNRQPRNGETDSALADTGPILR
jgi:hypothetical protein